MILVLLVVGIVLAVRSVSRSIEDGDFPIEFDDSGGISVDGPDVYGDDPELDALWDDCDDGDMASCDRLYLDAPLFSDYEAFGETCGERREDAVGGFCADGLGTGDSEADVSGEQPRSYGDDPELDALHDACGAGDDASCDELYLVSPLGSDYEEFGATCGGRQEAAPGSCAS